MKKSVISVFLLLAVFFFAASSFARTSRTGAQTKSGKTLSENARTQRKISRLRRHRRLSKYARRHRRHRRYEHFYTSSYDESNTAGDNSAGEDPVVRAAAIEALGNYNGTVLAIDPNNGRVLAMVNQKLALAEGAEPCSTIKLAVGLAALSERIVTKDTPVQIGRRSQLNLTQA